MKNYLKRFWNTQADYFKEYYQDENGIPFWSLLMMLAVLVLAMFALFHYLQQSA